MNLLKNSLVSKLMLAALMLVGAKAMTAGTRLYIEPIAIDNYEPKEVAVMFEHDGTMGAGQFDMYLSSSLQFTPTGDKYEPYFVVLNPEYVGNGHAPVQNYVKMEDGREMMRVMIVSNNRELFKKESGVLCRIKVQAREGMLDKDAEKAPDLSISLKNVKFNDGRGGNSIELGEYTTDVSKVTEISMGVTGSDQIVANPGSTVSFNLNLTNTVDVASFSFNLGLPEGFANPEFVKNADRVRGTANINYYPSTGNLLISDFTTNNAIRGNEGDILTVSVQVPEEFGESAVISFTDITVGAFLAGDDAKSLYGKSFDVTIINGSAVKKTADAKVAELKDALAAALAEIAEKYENVKDQFTGEEINTKITDLETAINAAYEDLTLQSKYDEIMAPAEEIATAIAALVPAAADAVRVAANQAAYEAEIAAIDAAAAKLDEALAAVKETYPDYNTEADVKAVNDAVAAAKTAAADALKAVETEGEYKHELDVKPIEDAIAAIAVNAKADADAKAEAARVAANKAAYDADLEAIKPFESQLAMALAEVADNKDYDVTADKAAAEKAIQDAKDAAAANLKAVEKEGEYKSTLDTAAIATAIAAIKKNSEAATAEAKRVADNKAAYEKDLADVAALQTKLNAAIESVKGNEDYDSAADAKAAQDFIDAAKKTADDDFAAVATEGNYASKLDAAAIEAAIEIIAKNADEASLKAANDKAKANADTAVAALKDELAAAQKTIAEDCPLVADQFKGEEIAAAIASLESAIAAAYEGKTLAGDYDKVMAPAATISESVKTLVSEAKAAQEAAKAEADRVAANKAAYDAEMALIQTLRDELQAEIDKFAGNGWEKDDFSARKVVTDHIDGLENKVKAENNRVIPSDVYANQLKDSDLAMARGLIQEYVQKVQTSGIGSIIADEDLKNVRIYTIDGVRHNSLVPGVNIIVKADGTTTKVYVK